MRRFESHHADRFCSLDYYLRLLSKVTLVSVEIEIVNPLNKQIRELLQDQPVRCAIGENGFDEPSGLDSTCPEVSDWDIELPDLLGVGIYESLSRLNHSCSPNLEFEYGCDNLARVRVLRPVSAGEQATIAYIDEQAPLEERRKELWNNYGFVCRCSKCLSDEEAEKTIDHHDDPGVSFETFLDALVDERVLDLKYNGVLPALIASLKRSCWFFESTLFGPRSKAASIFLKASLHKESYRKCGVEPIFKPHETQKYLQKRQTIVHFFKRAKAAPPDQKPGASNSMDYLKRTMDYMYNVPNGDGEHTDAFCNRIITGDELMFSESEAVTGSDKSDADIADSDIAGNTTVGPNTELSKVKCDDGSNGGTSCVESSSGLDYEGDMSQDSSVTGGTQETWEDSDLLKKRRMGPSDAFVECTTATQTDYIPNATVKTCTEAHIGGYKDTHRSTDASSPTADLKNDSNSESCNTLGPSCPAGDASTGSVDASTDSAAAEKSERSHFCNSSVIMYGRSNLMAPCYYAIRHLLSKPMSELLAYPEHFRTRYTFVLWQNPCLQHLCGREVRFAYLNNEITAAKVIEILSNKKSKCCIVEDIDVLPEELQLVIAKHMLKHDRPFFFLSSQINRVSPVLRGIAFNFRVPPMNVDMLVDKALSQQLCPGLFLGMARKNIIECANRARDDVVALYCTLVSLQQKKTVSSRRDSLPLRRIVHCIAFQEKTMRTIMFIKNSVSGLASAYNRDPTTFWLEFLDEVNAVGRAELLNVREKFYHLIAQKSTLLASMGDPRVTLESTFLEMMDMVNGTCKAIR
ncbi:SET AND MYND DOMAIN CONTAINING, putative [Babesia bigemina]|uniref:SET AND MYND DOMAIN CONTAINING, putative n=1 Tax=Babesia bigemina TaxID=5866 RepID=A0A061DBV4_BABBI|nr:SET AND MYND DOMAIN CONTAINING, putative [Babesia bigemina]CDR96364.1 SET AND MYND DOMAIN CONTAINING, putative [Babesia bigemina]|eukprot:XP_012768550.1 SET AND MYND DOMAIN CONTAINING, putative [Babesia bigemina]